MFGQRNCQRLNGATNAAGAIFLIAAVCLGGCQSAGLPELNGSVENTGSNAASSLRNGAEELGRQYDRDPDDRGTALSYAQALRSTGGYAQAAAVLQRLAAKFPDDGEVLGAFGKALADAGRLREAAGVLAHAHTPERPDWSVLSAQGSVADELGDHVQAQAYYAAALKIVPGQPDVLSNLGLSYALSKKLPQAEKTLRQAAAHPQADRRVRQNLALVLALEGKYGDAEEVSQRDLEAGQAAANMTVIRKMVASQSSAWSEAGGKLEKTAAGRAAELKAGLN